MEPDEHCDKKHVHVFDEIYVRGALVNMIIEEARGRDWWDNVELVCIDVAGTQHHANVSQAEVWAAEGVGVTWRKIPVEDGILRHRTFLRPDATDKTKGRIFFNENCTGALREYGQWKRRVISGLRAATAAPKKINCDALKAINYGLVYNFGFVDDDRPPSKIESPFSF
jgi:hypothetical protein